MPQKLDSEAGAAVRAFDQAGNVGHHETGFLSLIPDYDHTQVWFKGRKRIVSNLRTGGGDA